MKKPLTFLLTVCLIFSLSGCFKGSLQTPQTSETVNQSDNPYPTVSVDKNAMVTVSVPTMTEQIIASDGALLFEYVYQGMSLILPDPSVANKVIIDFLNRVDSTRPSAESIGNDARSKYTALPNWIAFRYNLTYNPTRIDQNVLSLSGTSDIFTGGAHPVRTCVSVNYDLSTGDILTLASIMTVEATVEDFCNLVLEGLSERAEGDYLYEGYAEAVKLRFATDPTEDQDWFFSNQGLCFPFEPYEIAPYTSGVVTVTIPYKKLQGLLYKDYFPAQQSATTGSIVSSVFDSLDLSKFSHISELILDRTGKMYMLYSEGEVQNIQIIANGHILFAANKLGFGEGIMIQATEDSLEATQLVYTSNGQQVTTNIQ